MNLLACALIGVGAAAGAWLRWVLGLALNPMLAGIPLGTLSANWLGGYLMGIALGLFSQTGVLSPELRLMVTTGFLGGLTTFSTFSAETTSMLLRGEYTLALGTIALHVCGSLLLTWLGILSIQYGLARW
ncbi:fluoride efflux transporter CrcB [Chitinibacter tainanensis]|uniref:fluoride efflux transporter CrcB n=1 Tax=Chitinibacter tainanensis TaxID=230667 RepID=UPI0023537518|nr:fluoride efflux transporter CrcB [Chitinibacter tainanensis]